MRVTDIDGFFRLLESDGWTFFRREAQPTTWWKATSRATTRKIEVYLGVNGDFLYWQLPFVVKARSDCRAALCRYLCAVNYELRLLKFSMDEDDWIFLAAEVPEDGCDFEMFKRVLTAMRLYFEKFHREVEWMATNTDLGNAWLSLLPKSDRVEGLTLKV